MGCSLSARIKADVHTAFQYAHFLGESSHRNRYERLTQRTEEEILQSSRSKKLSYNEVKIATNNFCPNSVVGGGGFGCVFKGWVDEHTLEAAYPGFGIPVAVKRLNLKGSQGHKEWLTEINYLGRLEHPNLVKLIGYCLENEHHLLVYEFMACGSLDHHLFRRSSYLKTNLSWNLRMRIALDAAKGLAYLHSPKIRIIYRDFKTSNILLDADYNAKLSDFGLAKDGSSSEETSISTDIMGTEGYAAPEYVATGHLTTKSDVYSFGVVLLEIITGKRVLDPNRSHREENLIKWAKSYLRRDKVFMIMDPRVQAQYSCRAAHTIGRLVTKCLSIDPRCRPNMDEVVSTLEQLQECKDTCELYSLKGGRKCCPCDYFNKMSHDFEGKGLEKVVNPNDFVNEVGKLCKGLYQSLSFS